MLRQRNIRVLTAFSLYAMQHPAVKIKVVQFDTPHLHAAQPTAVNQTDEELMLQQFGTVKHTPDLFPTQDYRKFLYFSNGGKVQKTIRQTFRLQQKPKAINGMLKIRLRRSLAALLQFKKIVFYLLGVQFGGQATEMKRHSGHM